MCCKKAILVLLLVGAFNISRGQDIRQLTLKDCIAFALRKSPYAVQHRSDRASAATDVAISVGQLIPRLSISTDYSRIGPSGHGVIQTGTGGIFSPIGSGTSGTSSINISGDVVNIGTIAAIGQAMEASDQARENFHTARADFVFNIKQAYFTLVQQQRALALSKATVRQSSDDAELARQRLRLGALSRPDMLPFEVTLSQSLTDQASSRANVVAAQHNLAELLGVDPNFQIDTALGFPDTTRGQPSEDSLVAIAVSRSPQVRAASARVRVRRKERLGVIGQRLPILAASYSYGFADTTLLGGIGNSRTNFWNVQAVLTWNFFDGSLLPVLRKAGFETQSSVAGQVIARNSARQQMRQAVANLGAAREALRLIGSLLLQAAEDYRLQVEKNRLGSAVVLDVLSSRVRYREAQLRATQVVVDYYLADAHIKRILGQW